MATLSYLPVHYVSLSSSSQSHHQQPNSLSSTFYHSCFHLNRRSNYYRRQSIVCLAASKKSRPSRKLMSDEELCNVLRQFVASVGLPEGHVPSTKDLTKHGRKDLANIVRRRGHKLIAELISNASETVNDGFDSDSQRNLNDEMNGIYVREQGQGEKVNDLIEDTSHINLMNDSSATGNSLVTKNESAVSSNGQIQIPIESAASLQEKAKFFVKYGELDTVDDDLYGDLQLNRVEEGESSSSRKNLVESEALMHGKADVRHLAGISNNTGLNGSLMVQRLPDAPVVEDSSTSDTRLSSQGRSDADLDRDMNIEPSEMENEAEINRLKDMLHQKEFELSRLKREIEKEKQALSILQSKAESEINKAQKLISEKEAELHAAEESLSGLVEAKFQYSGEGQMVEVAGSFNGWHQRIKMEPQASSTFLDPTGTRKYRLWSTTLWLYPGLYEIKFVVDGHWQIDPQRETVMKDGMENNILRVER